MKVLCFGSMNIDYVYSVDHMVNIGETETSLGMSINPGGKGLNQSVALARAGVEVWHAGMIGREGKNLKEKCIEKGVNVGYVRTVEGQSGHTIIQVDKNGDNSIILFGGANQCMTIGFINEVFEGFGRGDMILLQNEINMLDVIIDKAYEKGMQIVLNPSPYNEGLESCDLSKISFFLLNEIEGEQMTGEKNPDDILKKIHLLYPNAKVVLTLGEAGSVYMDGDSIYRQEAFKVKAVDTTAAGDTFTGYFIASIIKGMTPEEGLRMASKAASIAVTKHGALDSIPYVEECVLS